MSKQCDIVGDLLPLYVDGACSETSADMVKEHLQSCSSCLDMYRKMKTHTSEDALKPETEKVITRHKKKENQQIIKCLFVAMCVLYFPALIMVSFFADGDATFISLPYLFVFTVLAMYSFPFYFAFIEFGLAVCRIFEKKQRTTAEKVFDAVGMILVSGIVMMAVVIYTVFDASEMVYLLIAAAVLLAGKWIAYALVCKKKLNFAMFRLKTFWICVVALTAVIALAVGISSMLLLTENVREDTAEFGYSIGVRACGSEYEGVSLVVGAAEQHSWDVMAKNPTMTVKWMNTTRQNVAYSTKCSIYRKTDDGWALCSADSADAPDDRLILSAGGEQTQVYSIAGYDISEGGWYKFVTYVENMAVWMEFEITIHDAIMAKSPMLIE